jgi:hypothetical protein
LINAQLTKLALGVAINAPYDLLNYAISVHVGVGPACAHAQRAPHLLGEGALSGVAAEGQRAGLILAHKMSEPDTDRSLLIKCPLLIEHLKVNCL